MTNDKTICSINPSCAPSEDHRTGVTALSRPGEIYIGPDYFTNPAAAAALSEALMAKQKRGPMPFWSELATRS
jgi:hypothetical protein